MDAPNYFSQLRLDRVGHRRRDAAWLKAQLADPATRNSIFGAMLTFILILFVGYIYAVKKRAFNWKE